MTLVPLLLLFCFSGAIYAQSIGDNITVQLPFGGSLLGYSNGDSWQFNGIPFAAPPIGELRWKDPQNFTYWEGTRDAKKQSAACIQDCTFGIVGCATSISEDCLYLNIYIPLSWTPESSQSYDVLIHFYGGGFKEGTSNCILYDARFLTNYTNNIIVTFNYRLGALGFLRKSEFNVPGNMGFRDQRMAMRWVKEYISHFGGRRKISLFGQSAGAISIGAHMTSPLSKGLFDKVILESDGWTIPFRSILNAEVLGIEYLWWLGCDSIHCLYNKTSQQILSAQLDTIPVALSLDLLFYAVPWTPIIDHRDLTKQPYTALIEMAKNGSVPPAIMGATSEGGYLFIEPVYRLSPSKGTAFFDAAMLLLFGISNAVKVGKMYESIYGTEESPLVQFSRIFGDYVFLCPARSVAAAMSEGTQKDVWLYVWDQPVFVHGFGLGSYCYGRPCHGAELPFVFGTPSEWGQSFSPSGLNLSRQVQTYWGNFAQTFDPNNGSAGSGQFTNWLRFNNQTQAQLLFQIPIGNLEYGFRANICDTLDSIGYLPSESSVVRSSLLFTIVGITVVMLINQMTFYHEYSL